jgi:hypothetical protein
MLVAVATGFVGAVMLETWGSLVGANKEDLLAARMLPAPAWQAAESGRPEDLGSAGRGITLCEIKRLLFSYTHMIATNGK